MQLENFEKEHGTIFQNNKVVYDCLDPSNYYENSNSLYLDPMEFVDLGPLEEEKQVEQPKVKRSNTLREFPQPNRKVNQIYTSLKPYYIPESEKDTTLVFESRFESGNLRRAYQQSDPNSYYLLLKFDHDTTTYT